jgi:LuxR family maltose regulon positive regulatory protein
VNGAKLRAPRSAVALLARPELEGLLERGAAGKLVLVCGPAGAGKSSAVAQWAASTERTVAWVGLDRYDADVGAFWRCVLAAFELASPGSAVGAEAALARGDDLDASVLALLAAVDRAPNALTLVLDDYHAAASDEVDDVVTRLVEQSTPALSLVIASRVRPALPLARWLVRRQSVEVDAGDLHLSPAETARVLTGAGIDAGADTVARLHELCEGWAAGVSLAALAMSAHGEPSRIVDRLARGRNDYLREFLVDEVLALYPPEERRFLEDLSVLPRFVPALASAVTGRADAAAVIDRLRRANAFIVETEHPWFRFHHLFGELLRDRLETQRPDEQPALHRRAARWWAGAGFADEAVDAALAGQDWDLATDLLRTRAVEAMHQEDRPRAVFRWLDALPAAYRDPDPMLRALYETSRFHLGLEPVRGAGVIEWPADEDLTDIGDAFVWGIRASTEGDVDVGLRLGRRILALALESGEDLFIAPGHMHVAAYLYRSGDLGGADTAAEAVAPFAAGSKMLGSLASAIRAVIAYEQGDLTASRALTREARALHGEATTLYGFLELAEARLALEDGELERATATFAGAIEAVEPQHVDAVTTLMHASFAIGLDGAGDVVGAAHHARRASELAGSLPNPGDHVLELVAAAETAAGLPPRTVPTARTGVADSSAGLVEPLSDRERQVLRLLGGDLTLREIADELYVSHNTIKSHARAIYRKLGVTTRAEAWERARGSRLLVG